MAEPRVVIVGAGPAGVRAAETLAAAGLRPTIIDEGARPGGRIYQQPSEGAERSGNQVYGFDAAKAARLHAVLPALREGVDYRPQTLVWNIFEGRLDLLKPDGAMAQLGFDALLLATGATDLALPFPGWTLPGVFTLGGAQIALKTQGCAIGRRVVFLGAGPLLPLVAWQYLEAGGTVAAVLDATPFAAKLRGVPAMVSAPGTLAKGAYYLVQLRRAGVPSFSDVRRPRIEGDGHVESIRFEASGRAHTVACDAVGASFGLRSETQLADLAGCRFSFSARARQWLPVRTAAGRSSRTGIYLAGDGAGIGGADAAELAGERAALAVLEDLGRAVDVHRVATLEARLGRLDRFRRGLETAYPFASHLVEDLPDDTHVCRCEGIDAGTLRATVRDEDVREVNRLKALTRIGMGRCQGRMCGLAAAEVLAAARGEDVAAAGRLRGQPPIKPIPIVPEALE
ncbi:MAG: FAD/NAD(P)-binding oxidoreductase [Alphaproteobacteria bacterium]|nr:FAD/NAD(P)-binding oxidoreductase [Alphaproteobacteria bacterium]